MPQILASLEMLGMARVYTVTLMIGTSDVSRGESRKVMKLQDKMSCILEELRIQMDPAILTVCTIPHNMKTDQHALEMNTKVRNLNEIIRQIHQRSALPVGLLDVAEQMERSVFPDNASSDGIHFDSHRRLEWLNDVFQRHKNALEAELLETAQFTFGPPPNPPFFNSRTLSSRLGATADSRDSSRSSRTRLPGAAPMEAEEATSSTPQSSVVSSVVVVESKRVERPAETSRSRYWEKVKELDLEDLECRQALAEALGLEQVSHEELSRHQCVDWLKAHETHFSRAKIMETADLTGIPTKLVMGPINYRPLKLLGSPGLIVEPPHKHRTSIARIRLATPAQLRVVDKLLDPREMELPDAAYEGTRLADDPRYGKPCGNTQLAKTLAVYDRADPAAVRVVIVAGSDFEGTSPKLFWPETLIYSLPGAELNHMLTLVVAIKSEMPCEPELLLIAGMNNHLHATGFLEQLKGDEPAPKRIWEAIRTLFAAMNEVQENVISRFGSKTRVVFTTSPGYASMPPALQFVCAVLILIAEGNGWRILMAAPNRELNRRT